VIVIDTDVATFHQRGHGATFEAIVENITGRNDSIWITIVTFEEQMRGWLAKCAKSRTPEEYIDNARHLRKALDYYRHRSILDFDSAAAMHYRSLSHLKTRIGTMDLRIAAIARSRDATLVTHNTSDFRQVPGLRIEDWTIPPKKP
jgi:tRNA(fMet)-specific endonuclease VapC